MFNDFSRDHLHIVCDSSGIIAERSEIRVHEKYDGQRSWFKSVEVED